VGFPNFHFENLEKISKKNTPKTPLIRKYFRISTGHRKTIYNIYNIKSPKTPLIRGGKVVKTWVDFTLVEKISKKIVEKLKI